MSYFVLCDFSKALDKVWHRGLLHKLKAYGINGNLLDWFHSYLKFPFSLVNCDLSVFTKDVFDISFVNGPGLTSTFPIISVK
jgi:hypothetical protein